MKNTVRIIALIMAVLFVLAAAYAIVAMIVAG